MSLNCMKSVLVFSFLCCSKACLEVCVCVRERQRERERERERNNNIEQ